MDSNVGSHDSVETPSALQRVERATGYATSIKKKLTRNNLALCNAQEGSPLYRIPKEIRDIIFRLATSPYPNPEHMYGENDPYYRPGYTGRLRTSSSILYTCRWAWLEANALPMQQAVHTYWLQRGPHDALSDQLFPRNITEEYQRWCRMHKGLTKHNIRNLTYVHLFLQQGHAERTMNAKPVTLLTSLYARWRSEYCPKILHITMRQSDWEGWERGAPLAFDENWIRNLVTSENIKGVEEFRLELETLEERKRELEAIVCRLRAMDTALRCEAPEAFDSRMYWRLFLDDTVGEFRWSRSSRLDDREREVFGGKDTIQLYCLTLTWRAKVPRDLGPIVGGMYQLGPATRLEEWTRPKWRDSDNDSVCSDSTSADTEETDWDEMEEWGADIYRLSRWNDDAPICRKPKLELQKRTWYRSVGMANDGEDSRREKLCRMFRHMVRADVEKEWEKKGSLLKFRRKIDAPCEYVAIHDDSDYVCIAPFD